MAGPKAIPGVTQRHLQRGRSGGRFWTSLDEREDPVERCRATLFDGASRNIGWVAQVAPLGDLRAAGRRGSLVENLPSLTRPRYANLGHTGAALHRIGLRCRPLVEDSAGWFCHRRLTRAPLRVAAKRLLTEETFSHDETTGWMPLYNCNPCPLGEQESLQGVPPSAVRATPNAIAPCRPDGLAEAGPHHVWVFTPAGRWQNSRLYCFDGSDRARHSARRALMISTRLV